jgi:hypothetical protein
MGYLKNHILGPFRVRLDDQLIIQFDTEKTRALLAYLASESGHPRQREYFAEMFLPERHPSAARGFLRVAGVVPGVRGLDAGQALAAARQHCVNSTLTQCGITPNCCIIAIWSNKRHDLTQNDSS